MSALLAQARRSLRGDLDSAERALFERLAQSLERQQAGRIRALNQAIRCMRADSDGRWSAILMDATRGLADRAVLFSIRASSLHFEMARGLDSTSIADTPLADAPAFQAAFESRDRVVAVRTRGELSDALASLLGEAPDGQFSVFPILAADRVAALLYADSQHSAVESDTLELLAGAAGAVIEARGRKTPDGLVALEPAAVSRVARSNGASMDPDEPEVHRRAQRFARVQAAEIRLYKSKKVKIGRACQRLYASLREEIDSAREIFRRDYLSASPGMVDYLHLELVRTLANDDVALLGPDYPGPMV